VQKEAGQMIRNVIETLAGLAVLVGIAAILWGIA
jgi:hypothetical protein